MAIGFQTCDGSQEGRKERMVSPCADPYHEFIGEYVEVVTQPGLFWGKYQGLADSGNLILCPSFIRNFNISYLEERLPTKINIGAVAAVCPISKDSLEKRIEKSNKAREEPKSESKSNS